MEKEKFLSSESIWSSCSFGMEMQPSELNSGTEQLPNCFLNPNWENSMDQSDPFESALSSMVSSPVASNGGAVPACGGGVGDSVMIRELIGRIGSIWGSDETSPQSYIIKGNNNGSTNTSCYRNPLGSPPELILSRMDSQIRGNLPNPGNQLPNHPSLAQFAADPGFAERAARFSCFSSRNFEGLNGQLGLNDPIGLPHRLMPRIESAKLSKVSSNQSMKVAGSQVNAQESNKSSPQDADSGSDKKTSNVMRPSMPETVELGDSRENSSLSEQILGGELSVKGQNDANSRKRKSIPKGKAKETSSPSASDAKVGTDNDESSAKRSKQEATTGNENEAAKAKAESNGKARNGTDGNPKQSKENAKPPEPPKDYIHVRARRGQATDSHSLAERVRREKISERMKFLQDLVPGCNKVTGKAVMLDEIINYVQSLQRQVEFLSMKLATVNPRMDFNVDALLSKAMFQSRGSLPQSIYPVDASTPGLPYGYQPQQGLPVRSDISNSGEAQFSMNPLNTALRRNPSIQLPALDGFSEAAPQASMFWEDDLQSIVQMGFGQNQLQSIHGPMAAGQMKVEL